MREVEVKAKVDDLKSLRKQLEDRGCKFGEPVTQHDKIFLHKDIAYKDIALGITVLRIRTQGSKHIFTLKVPLTNMLDKREHETEVTDPEQLEKAFELMGYYKALEVKKIRVKGEYSGDEICLDSVENLGDYVEMERLAKDSDPEAVQKELFSFLKELGISEDQQVRIGYDILLYQKGFAYAKPVDK